MSISQDFHELVGSIYDAALEPRRWTNVLEEISAALGAQSAALHSQDQVTGKGWGITSNIDPAAPPLYFGYFATRNVIRRRRNECLELDGSSQAWRRRVIHDEHLLPKGELVHSEYYADFLKRFDLHSLLMMGLAIEERRFASLNFYRPARREQFGQSEIDLATKLQPHFIRSFELSLKLSDLQRIAGGFADFFDRSPNAVFLVDGAGHVHHLNRAAEALVAAGTGLKISSGVLVASGGRDSGKFRDAIADAAAAEARAATSFALSRPDRRSLAVTVCNVRRDRLAGFAGDPLVMVCVSDPESGLPMPAERLQQLYGLTPAEAKVAIELSLGCEPKLIAERLSLTVNTVRFQIARIFAKTQTSRQAELVRLLGQVCGTCLDWSEPAAARKN